MSYCEVALTKIPKILTYRIPPRLELEVGQLVLVPIHQRRAYGVVVSLTERPPSEIPESEIKDVIEAEPLKVPEKLIGLAKWISSYYMAPLKDAVRLFLPPGTMKMEQQQVRFVRIPDERIPDKNAAEILGYLKDRGKTWVSVKTIQKIFGYDPRPRIRWLHSVGAVEMRYYMPQRSGVSEIDQFLRSAEKIEIPKELTSEQVNAIRKIGSKLGRSFEIFLLHGVTGSGKTQVYIELTKMALSKGMGVIVLVPEIGLTPQLAARFIHVFGDVVGLYHSKFSVGERRWVWREAEAGRIKVVIGPRSSLFLPVNNLGLIIVDEEHDTSYKQSDTPPLYHARAVAIMRAKLERAVVLLGSATPSIESYHFALKGRYRLVVMPKKIRGYKKAVVEIVDLRKSQELTPLSTRILEEMERTVANGKQIILFVNLRGFAPHLQCLDCGYSPHCPHCSVSLTYHKREKKLKCHLCGYEVPAPSTCPKCGSPRIVPIGFGTEQVESEVRRIFPKLRVVRMDMDTTRRKRAHEEIYRQFKTGEADVLVGTQMVVKGFDFPNVGLVGVLLADVGLNFPDFRANERVFQLITQVIGRIRRGGKVIVQTFDPDSIAISKAVEGDFLGFYRSELLSRQKFEYPPFVRLGIFEIQGRSKENVMTFAYEAFQILESSASKFRVKLLGPAPAPIEKFKSKYRWRIMLKSEHPMEIQNLLKSVSFDPPSGINIKIDIDPVDML